MQQLSENCEKNFEETIEFLRKFLKNCEEILCKMNKIKKKNQLTLWAKSMQLFLKNGARHQAPSVKKKSHVSLYDSYNYCRYYYCDDCSNGISDSMLGSYCHYYYRDDCSNDISNTMSV